MNMDTSQAVQLITGLAAFISAMTGFGSMILSRRNSKAIAVVRNETNGLKDELVREVRTSSHAQGLTQGRAENGKHKRAPRKPKHK